MRFVSSRRALPSSLPVLHQDVLRPVTTAVTLASFFAFAFDPPLSLSRVRWRRENKNMGVKLIFPALLSCTHILPSNTVCVIGSIHVFFQDNRTSSSPSILPQHLLTGASDSQSEPLSFPYHHLPTAHHCPLQSSLAQQTALWSSTVPMMHLIGQVESLESLTILMLEMSLHLFNPIISGTVSSRFPFSEFF